MRLNAHLSDITGDEIVVLARGVVDDVKRPQLLQKIVELQRLCAAEPGTLLYMWCVDRTDPSVLWANEIYRDMDALRAHRANVRPFLPALSACFLEPPTPHRCSPLILSPS